MIKKLKRRFIILAMVSLAVLLAVIVAGMNIINYEKVVSDADERIEVIEENYGRILGIPGGSIMPRGDLIYRDDADDDEDVEEDFDADDMFDRDDGPLFGRHGDRGPSMTHDEAEESRFFMATVGMDGDIQQVNVDRISSVDESEAISYAKEALSSGKDEGFVGEFRYSIEDDGPGMRITFLDCGRVLESFRDFLRYSILMSLAGLAVMFGIITFFAGRIVRPVAESYEKQKRFITDAGHEIKTPLAIIKANIDLMDMELEKKKVDKAELKENLGDIDDQVDRLTGLTNDLVYLSRMEEAGDSLVMSEVPFSDIVSETVSSFEPLAEEKGKAIRTDIEPMVSVNGSTKELEKLLSILLENAVKYSPAGPEAQPITVSMKKEGRNAVLEVSNAAENELTNESLSHVFERFYRTDSSRSSATGGHGIGLSVASAIVSAHGGKISARTSDGHDFTVTAILPPS
jgi:signal transduction histidine kinase